ncbi:hypothetical protein ABT288_40335, partial [Streptomyces sp. NPDC001093]
MTERTRRLGRLRRMVPEGRSGRATAEGTARPAEARGGRPRRRGGQPQVVARGGGVGLYASPAAQRRDTRALTALGPRA